MYTHSPYIKFAECSQVPIKLVGDEPMELVGDEFNHSCRDPGVSEWRERSRPTFFSEGRAVSTV